MVLNGGGVLECAQDFGLVEAQGWSAGVEVKGGFRDDLEEEYSRMQENVLVMFIMILPTERDVLHGMLLYTFVDPSRYGASSL